METITINGVANIDECAARFLQLTAGRKHFAFLGPMGAGKTTFIKAICEQLKVVDIVSSPTFAIINEYRTENQESIYHFDFYRIKSIDEAFNLGYEEYFYSDNYCFIEWPEKVDDLIDDDFVTVEINPINETERVVTINI